MAKYAYAPLSIDDNRRKEGDAYGGGPNNSSNYYHGSSGEDRDENSDHLVNERMPLCVGVCVLLAIVYVLSRTGERADFVEKNNANMRVAGGNNNVATTVATMAPGVLGEVQQEMATAATTPITTATGAVTTTTGVVPPTPECPPTPDCPSVPECPPVAPVAPVVPAAAAAASSVDLTDTETANAMMAQLREKALSASPPHIIECAKAEAGETQSACHLPSSDRYVALGQKGATLWMTGCSGAGKTTIATALESLLVKQYGKHVYRLDGDNLRTGLNRDLSFSESDRAESVRRTGEMATLFSDAGIITLVGLISPYREDRDLVRKRHEDQNIPFYEIFLDVPVDELKKRDPKGQYARVESGELKHFTCIDDPYEEPLAPEITLKTHELQIEQSVNILLRQLERDGILIGPEKVTPSGLPNPDGDEIIDLHVPEHLVMERTTYAQTLPKVLINNVDLNWLQVVGEGWAAPLKGFMREGTLLETLHFNSILIDPFNITGNKNRLESKTDFNNFPEYPSRERVSMSLPITLSITSFTKQIIENSFLPETVAGTALPTSDVALVTQAGDIVAILKDYEIYNNRKEEIVTRMYGVIDMGHPYIEHIYKGGDYLIGGEIELLSRIRYNDGLDQWRKTVPELLAEFEEKGADTVYAFQTRNPTHAGHAYLMNSAGADLREQGYKKPVLWLSPLGGWTKSDDVPLDVRVKQHEEVLNAGTTHPGGLDPDSTVMAIWPSPMVYAGPTEVEFHAKSRKCAGASYFVVGRDPAGMKGSSVAVAHPDDDLYDGDHGRYVLQNSPGIAGQMKLLSFVKVMYDIQDNTMKTPDESRMEDFISISGTKMRLLARNGAVPCSATDIPTDLVEANCIPSGFMVPKGWDLVVDYYKNVEDTQRWIPWSQPRYEIPPTIIDTGITQRVSYEGIFGTTAFSLKSIDYESWWHDIPVRPSSSSVDETIINFVVEIPMFVTAKMEVQKDAQHNVIAQDTNKDGSARYYTYGTPFFNYGFIPQTWEDPEMCTTAGNCGDNDPLDVMEINIGNEAYSMGSIHSCRVIGSLELIDEGETDHKIICVATDTVTFPQNANIRTMDDLETYMPGTLNKFLDWLKRYKTSDGKPENKLASEIPKTVSQAVEVINETHEHWRTLCGHGSTTITSPVPSKASSFWLDSPACRGA